MKSKLRAEDADISEYSFMRYYKTYIPDSYNKYSSHPADRGYFYPEYDIENFEHFRRVFNLRSNS